MVDERKCVNCIHFEVCAYVDPMLPVCDSYAEPVKHGRWVKIKLKNVYNCMITAYECTNCKKHSVGQIAITMKSGYCPNCGAKMDGGAENE